MEEIKFTVNGESVAVTVDPDMPLVWVLRDKLGLTGTKFSCGIAECGVCTVLMDDEAVRSCVTSAAEAAGTRITTIEGLGKDRLHPLQEAWEAEQVPQCGFCQSGQLMTAAGLLKANPRPDDAAIEAEMSDLLCRCGTYPRIRKAIARAAGRKDEGGNG